MAQRSDDGESIQFQAGNLTIPYSPRKYGRFWSRLWNVGRFIWLCKKGSILKQGAAVLSGVPLLLPQHPTTPLLQCSEQHHEGGSSSSSAFWPPPKSLLRRSPSSAHHSQFSALDLERSTYSVDLVPSPSTVIPLLQSAQTELAIRVESDEDDEEKLQRKIARIFDEKDLDSLREFGGAEKLARAFGSDLESGKNPVSLQPTFTYKKQVLAKDFPRFFIRACNRFTIFLLIIFGCSSLGFEMVQKSFKHRWPDAAAIFLAVFLIVTADSVSSFRQARKQEEKMLKESQIKVTVIRNRESESIPIYDIRTGELLCLEPNQTVPADGLLVLGSVEVDGHFDKHIDCNDNPFLFSGSMVVGGEGRMLVTSVGSNAASSEEEALLAARISKPNTWAEFFSLCVTLLIVLVLFLRFLPGKHGDDDDGSPSQIKGEITVRGVLGILERMLLKPRGTVSILASSMAAVVIGIQHGMPFVISISLAYWNEKTASDQVVPLTLSACGTMGLVTVIVFDISGGLIIRKEDEEEEAEASEMQQWRTMKEAVSAFKTAGVDIKLVSGDEDEGLPALTQTASDLGIFTSDSTDDEAITGQTFRNIDHNELKTRADRIKVMVNFLPKEKLSMVQCLKEKGHVVAFYGGSTARDAPALKAADVGICDKNSAGTAKKCSGIIIGSRRSFNSLIPVCKCGRWAYYNIQKFIQLQLTVMISSLVITSVATMALRESPITLIQSIWVNLITTVLGGLMIISEPRSRVLEDLKAARDRDEPVLTKAMGVHILLQILYQASVLLVFVFEGQNNSIPGIDRRARKALIFNTFALCQVFNYANAMELKKRWCSDGVRRLQKGYFLFLLVAVAAAAGAQVLVAEIWARLNWWQWGLCFLMAALPWGLELALSWSFASISSHLTFLGHIHHHHLFFFFVIIHTLFPPGRRRRHPPSALD